MGRRSSPILTLALGLSLRAAAAPVVLHLRTNGPIATLEQARDAEFLAGPWNNTDVVLRKDLYGHDGAEPKTGIAGIPTRLRAVRSFPSGTPKIKGYG